MQWSQHMKQCQCCTILDYESILWLKFKLINKGKKNFSQQLPSTYLENYGCGLIFKSGSGTKRPLICLFTFFFFSNNRLKAALLFTIKTQTCKRTSNTDTSNVQHTYSTISKCGSLLTVKYSGYTVFSVRCFFLIR